MLLGESVWRSSSMRLENLRRPPPPSASRICSHTAPLSCFFFLALEVDLLSSFLFFHPFAPRNPSSVIFSVSASHRQNPGNIRHLFFPITLIGTRFARSSNIPTPLFLEPVGFTASNASFLFSRRHSAERFSFSPRNQKTDPQ